MVSRKTLVAALSLLEGRTHAEIGKFSLIHSVENETLGSSKAERINNLTRYLISKRLEEREAVFVNIVVAFSYFSILIEFSQCPSLVKATALRLLTW
ncbi:hypothetical protein [Bacillus massilinigeriensis]|uniref:hypothetical protein n=1 Tax=Bacillus massilionigeriensis TaxID=1805475 RepID=UPI00096B0C22|nr:hypothetical protein [Bacillus massilionigeriensis]